VLLLTVLVAAALAVLVLVLWTKGRGRRVLFNLFDSLTPAQKALLWRFSSAGVQVLALSSDDPVVDELETQRLIWPAVAETAAHQPGHSKMTLYQIREDLWLYLLEEKLRNGPHKDPQSEE
jgi:hypothetical protein